eukprot:TRINITY_DN9640_c0_g1_i1.p1 TRINITY_DN9640_c0_g1~~TRINITY_DN9640_c0_g1_i1.p1  ORF type:complete len:205 (-),score=52.91 TRINITY_DN9640_c0_g1_i1:41-655(-)
MSILEYNGGCVLAMAGKGCVAIASDLRLGSQAQTIAFDKSKVFKLNDQCFIGLPGLLSDSQTFVDKLKFRTALYKLKEGREMQPSVLSHVTANMLYQKRFGPYFIEPVIAGLDENGDPFISAMDLIGAPVFAKDFVLAGTSSESLYGMSESLWREGLEPEDLFEVISQALLSAFDRDAVSGWGAVVHIITQDEIITRKLKARQD